MVAVPSYSAEFQKQFGNVSLSCALFQLAPPAAALDMMNQKFIQDLNELTEKSVSLLGFKATQFKTTNDKIPSWDDFEQHGAFVWSTLNPPRPTSSILLASMIFSGADPWKRWEIENIPVRYGDRPTSGSHPNADSFFSLMCFQRNTHMIELLVNHPQFPGVKEIEKLRIQDNIRGDESSRFAMHKRLPLLHYMVNQKQQEIVNVLIELGYDVNLPDDEGNTPLFYITDCDMVRLLIEKGADVSIKNHLDEGAGEYWSSTIGTAAKKAELNTIVLTQMKGKMPLSDVQRLQRPVLINEILSGTKTNFMSVYRSGKFKPTVEFPTDNGTLNLLSFALLRGDEKTGVFLKTFNEMGVSWSHSLWEDAPHINNALLSKVFSLNEVKAEEADHLLKTQYKATPTGLAEYQKDLLTAYTRLSQGSFYIESLYKNVLFAFQYERLNELLKVQDSWSYRLYDFKKFQATFDVSYLFGNHKFTLWDHPEAFDALYGVYKSSVTHMMKNNTRNGLLSFDAERSSEIALRVMGKSLEDSRWVKILPFMLYWGEHTNAYDKSWKQTVPKILATAGQHPEVFTQDHWDCLEALAVDKQQTEDMIAMKSILQKGRLMEVVNTEEPPTAFARRKM